MTQWAYKRQSGYIWFYINGKREGRIGKRKVFVNVDDQRKGHLADGREVYRYTTDDENWIYEGNSSGIDLAPHLQDELD